MQENRHQHAAARVVEEPCSHKRESKGPNDAAHNGRGRDDAFLEIDEIEKWQVPDGDQYSEDRCGDQRRAGCLQARESESPPSRLLANWAIKRIDQTYAEDQQPARYRGETLARDIHACRKIEQHSEPVDRQRKSDGHHVPVPSHPPADDSKAKFLESGSASGEWSND